MGSFLCLLGTALWLHSTCFAAVVEQTPLFQISSLGQNVSLTCWHDDAQFIYKYWYRQEEGKELVFIGHMYRETVNMETFAQGKMSIKPSGFMKSQLIIYDITAQDGAIYYCASSIHNCFGVDVIQSPKLKLPVPGDDVSLDCEHRDSSYNYKYWYVQKEGRELSLIGYAYRSDEATMEDKSPSREIVSTQDDPQKSTLKLYSVSAEDSAVYYCASSTQ